MKSSAICALSAFLACAIVSNLVVPAYGDDVRLVKLPNRYPRMVHEYFISRLKRIEKDGDAKRSAISTRQQAEAYVDAVRTKIDRSFSPWPEKTPLKARTIGTCERAGYPRPFAIYSVETEPGMFAIVYRLIEEQKLQSVPPPTDALAILYVAHQSSDKDLRTDPLIKDLLEKQPSVALYTCDVRGVGESKPNIHRAEKNYRNSKSWGAWGVYGSDYMFAGYSLMLDEPYVGQRTFDVMRVVSWLKSLGHREIHIVGRGWGAIPAAYAALLSDDIDRVTLKNALCSYQAIAESEDYGWPLSCFSWNVLAHFDLPDVYDELEKTKGLKMVDTWNEHAK